jgi:hypothetical protein
MLHRFDFEAYQHGGVEFAKSHENCALWEDPGLGKTVQGLTAAADLISNLEIRRALVIAPLRVARKVWKDELAEWSHLDGLTMSCMTGSAADKFKALKVPADIHTINREGLAWLIAQFVDGKRLIKKWPWQLVIADESQSFRNQSSQRYKALKSIRPYFDRMMELTGSCAPGGYHNLWAQFCLLDGGKRLGYTEQAFLSRWFDEPTQQNGHARPRLKPHSKPEIQAAIADITYTLRAKDHLRMGEVRLNRIRVELSGPEMQKYRKMAREAIFELKDQRNITAVNAGVLHGKLLQLANGAIYTDAKGTFEEFHTAKLEALEEQLETLSVRGPVLVVYHFQHDLKRIGPILDRFCGKEKSWLRLRTDASFSEWATGNVDFGVLHPATGGHGLNDVYKSGAQDILHFGLSADYELYDQVNKRLTGGHRSVGRTIGVHHILADGTQDEHTYQLLTSKAEDQDDLTDAMARLTTSTR